MYTVKVKTGQQILFGTIGIAGLCCYPYLMSTGEELEIGLRICVLLLDLADVCLILYCTRMRVKVYIDYFVYYPPIGRKKIMKWNEIGMAETVKTKYGEDIIIYDKNDHRVCHLGAGLQNVEDFISTVRMHRFATWQK